MAIGYYNGQLNGHHSAGNLLANRKPRIAKLAHSPDDLKILILDRQPLAFVVLRQSAHRSAPYHSVRLRPSFVDGYFAGAHQSAACWQAWHYRGEFAIGTLPVYRHRPVLDAQETASPYQGRRGYWLVVRAKARRQRHDSAAYLAAYKSHHGLHQRQLSPDLQRDRAPLSAFQ